MYVGMYGCIYGCMQVCSAIQNDLKERFNVTKIEHKMNKFQDNYLKEEIFGKIEGNELMIFYYFFI